jgi:hypothetical protein
MNDHVPATSKDRRGTGRPRELELRKHRMLLIQGVRTHILPALLERGFVVNTEVGTEETEDLKWAGTFPFGLLRRPRTDGGADLVEIQFMTYQRAAFRINVCPVPKEGILTIGGRRCADELHAGGLHDHFAMYKYPRWWLWFSLWLWRFRKPVQSAYDKLALRVAGFMPEVELALHEKRLGPHMRAIKLPRGVQPRESSQKRRQ